MKVVDLDDVVFRIGLLRQVVAALFRTHIHLVAFQFSVVVVCVVKVVVFS